jgi:hypothetical protein
MIYKPNPTQAARAELMSAETILALHAIAIGTYDPWGPLLPIKPLVHLQWISVSSADRTLCYRLTKLGRAKHDSIDWTTIDQTD